MNPIAILLIGGITVGSVWWQLWLAAQVIDSRDGSAPTAVFLPPFIVGGLITVGILIYSIFMWIDDSHPGFGFTDVVSATFFALVFSVVMTIKNALGPIVNGWLVNYSLYQYFEHDTFEIWPFMVWIIQLIIDNAGNTAVLTYTIIFMLGSVICGGIGSVIEN